MDLQKMIGEPILTDAERALRDRFAREYVEDYNPVNAALRIGFPEAYAKEYGFQWLKEPYTLRKIVEMERGLDTMAPEEHRQRIVAGLYRESRYNGMGASHGARVAALREVAKVYGLNAPDKIETVNTDVEKIVVYLPDNGR